MDDLGDEVRQLVEAGQLSRAFDLLHQAYANDIARFVRHEGPSSSFEDVSQEVWAAAHRALPQFRFDASPKAWLFGIAQHKAADARRRKRRAKAAVFPSRDESADVILRRIVGSPLTPSSQYRRRRRAQALEQALSELGPLDRKLVELRFFFGLKPSEIVAVLSLATTAHALSQRLVRALHRLRKALLSHDEFKRQWKANALR